jgi:voltage-gated potassium channel
LNDHWLKNVIENSDSRAGRAFDFSIQALIVISLVTFSIETLPVLSESTRYWLRLVEIVTVAIFTVEYIFRVFFANPKRQFVFSFFGIVDLLSILPFYISTGVDLRSVRAFRLLRLFRALKLVRYSKAIQRFHRALIIAREELVLYFIVTIMLIYFAGVGIYFFENDSQPDKFQSVFHSLWWAVATLTTVGYGDVYPITVGGRIFTFLMLLIGLGIVSVPAGIVSSALQTAREMETESKIAE